MKQTYLRTCVFLLMGICTCTLLLAQKKISGTVKTPENQALIGVTVLEEGTTNGALTRNDGTFSITVGPNARLIFSYVGYASQTVDVTGRTLVEVNMMEGTPSLEEAVVIGYGTRKKSDLTSAQASIKSEDFMLQPLVRMDQAIQGRAAGAFVDQVSGAHDLGYKIRIRGAHSISGTNNPMFIVDGLVIGDIYSLNVQDIASIEILKDAAATAIYGSRAANGVVLITTKTGTKGGKKIEFNSFWGRSSVVRKIDMLSPIEFALGVNDAEETEIFSETELEQLRQGQGEDWQDRLFRSASFSNYQLSASGGTEKMDYYISGNYYNADGIIIDQNHKRYTVRANVNTNLSRKLKVGINMYGSKEENTGYAAFLSTGLTWDPTTPAFTEDGAYNVRPLKPRVGNTSTNPLLYPERSKRDYYDNQLSANGYFNLNLTRDLVLNVSAGLENFNRINNLYISTLITRLGYGRVINQNVDRFQNINRLTYTNNRNPNHRFQIDAIHEQQKVSNIWTQSIGRGFFSDQTTYKNLGLATDHQIINRSAIASLQSYMGRFQYTLMDKFLLSASIRSDGSSKFRKGNRWGTYPSASMGWRLSKESIMKDVIAVNDLKLRASYGLTGRHGISVLGTRSIPEVDPGGPNTGINYPFDGRNATTGIVPPTRLANPDLTWEKTTQTNAGVDLVMWNSTLTLTVDYYRKMSKDLVVDVFLPEFVGPTVVAQNLGEVETRGFDIQLGLTPFRNHDWNIHTLLTLSRYKSEVLALPNDEPIQRGRLYIGGLPANPTRVEVGQPMSAFRGYIFEGVYQANEEDEASLYGRIPGDAKYRDLNEDGMISPEDITTIGDGNPDFVWGLNSFVSYKSFDLNFLLLGSHGNEIYNLQRGRMMGLGAGQYHATHGDHRNRWSNENPSNIPARKDGAQLLSSQFIEDGSYVALKHITLSYSLGAIIQAIDLQGARVFVNAENLILLSGYSGFDPQSSASFYSDVDLGVDYNAYPISRSFSAGINLTF